MAAPTPVAIRELMMRLRSSMRCSKKVICPPEPSSGSSWVLGLTSSWLSVVMWLLGGGVVAVGAETGCRTGSMQRAVIGIRGRCLLRGNFGGGFGRRVAGDSFADRRNSGFARLGRFG